MKNPENNFAFVDGQNLYFGIKGLGWKLDYKRLRVHLLETYTITYNVSDNADNSATEITRTVNVAEAPTESPTEEPSV